MAQIVVRNLDDSLKEKLRRAAASHGRSMEEEVRVILNDALTGKESTASRPSHIGMGDRIHALFMDLDVPEEFFTSLKEIRAGEARDPELRG